MAKTLLLCFFLIIFFHQIPCQYYLESEESETVVPDPVQVLSKLGFLNMSSSLKSLPLSQYSTITIFAVSDHHFRNQEQPLNLLKYHLVPEKLTIKTLLSLPLGTLVPTLLQNHSITVSTTEHQVSLDQVVVNGSIYECETMVVFAINSFLDFSLVSSTKVLQYAKLGYRLLDSNFSSFGNFYDLSLQSVTIFIPQYDEFEVDFNDFNGKFLKQCVPSKLHLVDLVNLKSGTELPTLLQDYKLKIDRSEDGLVLNGVGLLYQEIYSDKRVVIHGVRTLFKDQVRLESNESGAIRRCIVFYLVQFLMISVVSSFYIVYRYFPDYFFLLNMEDMYFNLLLLMMEFYTFYLDYKGNIALEFLTIPISYFSVYLVIVKYHHHTPQSRERRAYMIFDILLLYIVSDWIFFARLYNLFGEELPKQMEIAGLGISGFSLGVHWLEVYLHAIEHPRRLPFIFFTIMPLLGFSYVTFAV